MWNDFIKTIINPNMFWIPMVAIAVVILLAGVIGFINGFKASLYFFIWNIVGWVIFVFVISYTYSYLFYAVNKYVSSNTTIAGFQTSTIVKVALDHGKPLVSFIEISIAMISVNILALFFYLFFRKKIKRTMIMRTTNKLPTTKTRIAGAGIWILAVVPFSIGIVQTTSIFSQSNDFTKVFNLAGDNITFKKFGDLEKSKKDMSAGLAAIDNINAITGIVAAIQSVGPDQNPFPDLDKIDPQSLKLVIHSDLMKDMIDEYMDQILAAQKPVNINNFDPSVIPKTVITSLQLTDAEKEPLRASIASALKKANKSTAEIDIFIGKLEGAIFPAST